MGDIGLFSRLLALIELGTEDETGLHLLMLKLIYEMSRIQQLRVDELGQCWCESGEDVRI